LQTSLRNYFRIILLIRPTSNAQRQQWRNKKKQCSSELHILWY